MHNLDSAEVNNDFSTVSYKKENLPPRKRVLHLFQDFHLCFLKILNCAAFGLKTF